MKKRILFGGFLFIAGAGFAQMPDTVHSLNPVSTFAEANPDSVNLKRPVSVTELSAKELKRGTGLFLDDVINGNVPGVFMERRTISAGQQFNIRGYGNGARGTNGVSSNFDGQGTKVYLNNIPVTDAEGITLMDDVDFASVGNVSIQKGPSGALYGLAIAGVVNLKTITPEKGKISLQQDVLMGDFGLQRYTTHLAIGGARSSVLINYGKQYYDGFMPHTASQKDFVNLMTAFQPSEKQSISAYVGYSNSYDERNGELTIAQYNSLDYTGNPAYIKNDAHTNVMSIRTGVSHTYQLCKYFSNTTSLFGTGIVSNVSSAGGWTDKDPINYGLRSTFDLNIPLGEKFGLTGVIGTEMQRQDAQIIGYNMVVDSTNITGNNIVGSMRSNQVTQSKTISLFTEWVLNMPYQFSLTGDIGSSTMGIRLNDRFYVAANNKPVNNKPTTYSAFYGDMLSPHVALNKVFNKSISVYASYSVGYKAPVSSYFFIPVTGEVVRDLKPEKGTQIEIGTKGSLLDKRLLYELAAFNTVFSNKMTTVAVPNAANTATSYTYVANGGSQDHKGLEALVKYTVIQSAVKFISAVTPYANFCYADFKYKDYKFQSLDASKKNKVEVDYSGNKVVGVAPITFNAGIDASTQVGIYANVQYSYRDGMYFTSDQLNKTQSYNLLNAKIGFKRTFAQHVGLDVFVGANNITNTHYYYMVFLNQLPDAYLPAPNKAYYFGGIALKYAF
ncbi:MAG TPA: TonB-dependent receptor [Bacteroidia bacterium]|jgi:iron complex outermembrane receptor protein|nr:TonB-dependent receptor [Bacteroidia bacterium]